VEPAPVLPEPAVTGGDAGVTPPPALPAALVLALGELETAAVVLDAEGRVLSANRAALALGIVRRGRLQVDELAAAAVLSRVEDVPRQVAVAGGWLGRHRPDGAGPPLAARVRPLTGTEVPEATLLLVEDRSRALRALAARQDFVVNVSHELKTPVGAIALLAEALQQAADDPESVTRFARRIGLESQRLTRLVKEIVELSRVQLDDPLEHAEPVGLAEVVATAVDLVDVDADSRNIEVDAYVPPGLTVPGSRSDLVSAVSNLVGNAVSYSPTDTRITISATRVEDHGQPMVDLAVADQGIGIAADKLTRIFERFYRVDDARSRATGGTGLGLSIVKHVATGHGGSIRVWSVPGTGSTFTLRLPLGPGPEPKQVQR
jgi:two-component system sensor histidine kinase SenX3